MSSFDNALVSSVSMWKHISKVKWPWVCLYLACSLAVGIQLVPVLRGFFSPETTNSETKELNLQEIDFPLLFKICVDPSFNALAVEEFGYDSIWNYFAGLSRFNASIYDWAGHTRTSEVQDSVIGVYNKVKNPTTAQGLLTEFRVGWGPGDWSIFSSDQLYMKRPNYPHNCYTLDISNITRGRLIQTLYFFFKRSNNETVQVLAQGRGLETHREVYDNMLLASGDAMEARPGKLAKYVLKIDQNVFVEEDTSKNCRNYPNEDFKSYAACDDHFMKTLCDKAGLHPIWLKDNISEVTVHTSVNMTGQIK